MLLGARANVNTTDEYVSEVVSSIIIIVLLLLILYLKCQLVSRIGFIFLCQYSFFPFIIYPLFTCATISSHVICLSLCLVVQWSDHCTLCLLTAMHSTAMVGQGNFLMYCVLYSCVNSHNPHVVHYNTYFGVYMYMNAWSLHPSYHALRNEVIVNIQSILDSVLI